jgi:two-component system OmpR family response regulator
MSRVMIVEDEPQMRALLEEVLAAEGHETVAVGEGMAALAVAARSEVDAAVIDVMLPGMDGFELCRHLRRHGIETGVLLLTARAGLADRVAGLDSGADDYLTKPFEVDELRARLRALLRRQQRVPPTLAVGDLHLDASSLRARCAGRTLALSAKEFSLLRALAQRAGTTAPREDLLVEVWGSTERCGAPVVDQYVSHLRKKLAACGSSVTVSTVRGVGYRLDADGGRR